LEARALLLPEVLDTRVLRADGARVQRPRSVKAGIEDESMRITDALILSVPRSSSIESWQRMGRLDREAHFLRGLARHYGKIVLASRAGGELEALRAAVGPEHGRQIELATMAEHDPMTGERSSLGERVLARIEGAQTALVQTYELGDHGVAESLASQLRHSGVRTALVARGGFLPSRILAYRYGPHSAQAVEAGLQEQGICAAAQLVVGSSAPMLDDLCWRLGINPARTRLVRNFVPITGEPAGIAIRGRRHIFSWGELAISSRYDIVLEAVARMPEPLRSEIRVEIAGDGPERERLVELADTLGVFAEFPGEMPYGEFVDRCRACAVYVHAAVHNPQPLGVLEAMSNGAPVVVTDTPGIAYAGTLV